MKATTLTILLWLVSLPAFCADIGCKSNKELLQSIQVLGPHLIVTTQNLGLLSDRLMEAP